MTTLGKIQKVENLRSVWQHETYDFSKWLSQDENLEILSKTIEIDITLLELESSVGEFNVDLYAFEKNTGRKIIIENQLEDTDHEHLGKIITYASGKDAEIVVWIVKKARDPHKQAIEWLNQHTDENIGFFLLEIELWKINDSLPAPKFNVVERPNNWVKSLKEAEGLSDTRKLQFEFWQAFNSYSSEKIEFKNTFSLRKPQPQNWYDLSVGNSSIYISLNVNTQKNVIGTAIYIKDDKELFEKFKSQKDIIQSELNMKLEWSTASKDCRIFTLHNANIKKDEISWKIHFDWFCETALKFREVIIKYGK